MSADAEATPRPKGAREHCELGIFVYGLCMLVYGLGDLGALPFYVDFLGALRKSGDCPCFDLHGRLRAILNALLSNPLADVGHVLGHPALRGRPGAGHHHRPAIPAVPEAILPHISSAHDGLGTAPCELWPCLGQRCRRGESEPETSTATRTSAGPPASPSFARDSNRFPKNTHTHTHRTHRDRYREREREREQTVLRIDRHVVEGLLEFTRAVQAISPQAQEAGEIKSVLGAHGQARNPVFSHAPRLQVLLCKDST